MTLLDRYRRVLGLGLGSNEVACFAGGVVDPNLPRSNAKTVVLIPPWIKIK